MIRLVFSLLVLGSALSLSIVNRREALTGIAFAAGLPRAAFAFSQQLDDDVVEPLQQARDPRVDLNNAFVGDYQQFRGMYPHAAGKISSNGPYKSVKDIYTIAGITDDDKKMFKKYEKEFTVSPPIRVSDERITSRVIK